MKQFKIIYLYEIKKITGKRLFWITLALFLLLTVVTIIMQLLGKSYVDGEVLDTHYHMFLVDREYETALSGRAIDQNLLTETMDAYRTIPNPKDRYILTEEYQKNARPYSAIYQLIARWYDTPSLEDLLHLDVGENSFYKARLAFLKEEWQDSFLTVEEQNFWLEKETQALTPYIYHYHKGYATLCKTFNTFAVLIPLFIAVCLSGVFAEEHVKRTDQLLLSAVNGKNTVYLAKILAGITVSVCSCVLMVLTATLFSLGIFGAEGFGMQVQATLYPFSYPMSIGESCLILGVMALFVSILMSVLVMFLSETLRNSAAALSVCTGCIILTSMVSMPPQYRVLSQIWDSLPFTFLERTHVFDLRTIPLFGHCFVSWQIVPVLYLICSAGIALLGRRIYRNYQVSGR